LQALFYYRMGDDEMSDEITQGVTPEPQAESVILEAQPTADNTEVEALKKRIAELNRESADLRKKLEAFEKQEADRQKAQLSEVERLTLEANQAKAALIDARKIAIAAKHGLPDMLADRLKGDTIEDLEADAVALMKTIPQPKPAAAHNPTNPGAQGAAKETDAERRRRLFGG
jgi:hypothetical protein